MSSNSKYTSAIDKLKLYCHDLEGKTVLDIGCDKSGELLLELVTNHNIKEGVGINPVAVEKQLAPNCRVEHGDSRKLDYPDNYFDIITSLAAFEHFDNLDVAFFELHRVLKKGGVLYTVFGPIWSGPWGHHLWINHEGQTYNYVNTPLPPYGHLLMTKSEMTEHCQSKFEDNVLIHKIVDFIYDSPDQNRLFYEDYERLVKESPFQTFFFHGTNAIPLKSGYETDNYPELFKRLKAAYPERETSFSHNAIVMLLGKV
jgi:ubiquinone/menaquinone biosynthesis C-methylase UbiE